MYFPIGWPKVLNLDTHADEGLCNIISVQANHERELFFILTNRSIHIWFAIPAVEVVCHRRSEDSIESIGYNQAAIWRTDSSVIVVSTDKDQLLFYQIRRRNLPPSASSFLLSSVEGDSIYKLKHDSGVIKTIVDQRSNKQRLSESSDIQPIPALTIFSFGKLDLSAVGIACLMSAQEELVVGARNGEMYGIHWDGNIDSNFPWSLAGAIEKGSDHIVDLKFSSILAGFSTVFSSGRVGFMPNKSESHTKHENGLSGGQDAKKISDKPKINYLSGVNDGICTEVNHKYRLVAYGLKNSNVLVCNISEPNSGLVINHTLAIEQTNRQPANTKPVSCLRYSPDNFALAVSWQGGEFAIWSVFGSLLFSSRQWQLNSEIDGLTRLLDITSIAWGCEGYHLWLSVIQSEPSSSDTVTSDETTSLNNGTSISSNNEVLVMSFAHSNLSSNPHLACTSDSIILMSEDRLYIGPSVPHRAEFDHWHVVDLPHSYLNNNYPVRYATVDRECKNLAVAGVSGFAIYSIEDNEWKLFAKKSHEECFSVCGGIIWWQDYIVLSCYNFERETFELRAYLSGEAIRNENAVVQVTTMEVTRISIFENRLLVLYSDGTLGMFMLNLRRRPNFRKPRTNLVRSNSIVSASNSVNGNEQQHSPKSTRSDSIMSFNYPSRGSKSISILGEFVLQIAPIENLIISNLQANPYCISAIALTRLHFKNNRDDDSILLNACGKLFLLEREISTTVVSKSPSSELSMSDLSIESPQPNHNNNHLVINEDNKIKIEGEMKLDDLDIRVQSAKRLSNSIHFASASLKPTDLAEPSASSNVTFKAVSVIATDVEHFWISPDISSATELSYFKKSLWLSCGSSSAHQLQVWLPLLNDKKDPPTDLYVPDRIMLPIRCDIYPLAIRSSSRDHTEADDAIVLGAECDILDKDCSLFNNFPYCTVKRQCRVYLHRILRELLLNQHLGYYARKIAESCQSLPYFAHCFELLLHEVLEEEATSPIPLPDPMLPQVVRFIKEFPVYLETVVHCARKSELSMWSYLFDERAVGNPRRLFQECLEKHKLDTAASCLIILQSLDRNIVSQRMVRELIKAAKDDPKYTYLIDDLESFLSRADLDYTSLSSSGSPTIG